MDFYKISMKELRDGTIQLYPDWTVGRFKDLMVRGKSFYAIWDEKLGMWSTDEYDVQRLVDEDLTQYIKENVGSYKQQSLKSFSSNGWVSFKKFIQSIGDNSHTLDDNITFANTPVQKNDYVSRRLSYSLEPGTTSAWDELLGILYSEDERAKIEWAIGSIVSGDSKKIQKFFVFYGPAGSGKSTILNIIHKLFDGYVTSFDAKALGSNNNQFATEVFKKNSLVAIQHDGDLSKIDDNTKLNSIIAHEDMIINEKFKATYSARANAMLFMGTNQPVKIADAKSGIIRRLIDIHPTGAKIEVERYHILMQQIEFELGAIAWQCLNRFRTMGKHYYNYYRPLEMMLQTDIFYNFIEANYDVFKLQDGTTLKQAYQLYKEFCAESNITRLLPQYKFREELRNYFDHFYDSVTIEGVNLKSYYSGFKDLTPPSPFIPDKSYTIDLEEGLDSVFDRICANQPAQYAKPSGYPGKKWENVDTVLSDLDTARLHYVKVPEHYIVLDFDLTDEDGEKDIRLNIEAASKYPATYTEVSQSGNGLHLHYIYQDDVHELAGSQEPGIEIKRLLGDSSLRRKLTKCNSLDVAILTSGLLKKEKPVIEVKSVQSEKGLRDLIDRNLRKDIHAGTKPSIDFIYKILDDAYNSGLVYDVQDMRNAILVFASKSTNHSRECVKLVQKMQFVGKNVMPEPTGFVDDALVFFDVEVYPNLFVVCWKYQGSDQVVKMINPEPNEIEDLMKMKLIGFNNRRYDNHILFARFIGNSIDDLFRLSQKIIDGKSGSMYGEAYNLSYADIYDFSSKKQGLKKFQIDLGIHHMELDLPWDKPVPEEKWEGVVDYCANDVIATEKVFESREQDFVARKILADLSGLSINHTTQNHTAKIIFGDEKNPQKNFVYTDLSNEFKGYKFDGKESTYKNEIPGEGGFVYAEPGMYENVALLDVASMHPTSIERLNLFGPYTKNFSALKEARMAIKHKEYEKARTLLDGKLANFLTDDSTSEALSYALKIVINIVYGLTSASFPSIFKDNRNIDNIVAKRGALFMIDLKNAVQKKGFTVAHIKTDSIKIPDATTEIIQFVIDFGKKYGYDFEHEVTYQKFCLVNDAVYVAKNEDEWVTVGAQFQHPYVFKKLFSNEPIEFDDLCETKSVTQGSMYLDYNSAESISDMVHVGRTGSFVPVIYGGGVLWRVKDGKKYAVTGTKGHLWIEREIAATKFKEDDLHVDMDYFEDLRRSAFEAIDYFGPFNKFIERNDNA